MINFTCTKCGSREYITRKGRNHKGLYCLICGKLDRYLTRGGIERDMNNEPRITRLLINEKLPSLNDYIAKLNANKYLANQFKRDTETLIGWYIKKAKLKPIEFKVDIHISWHEKTARRDPDNVYSAIKYILDAMQKQGVLKDDGQRYIRNIYNEIIRSEKNMVDMSFIEVEEDL